MLKCFKLFLNTQQAHCDAYHKTNSYDYAFLTSNLLFPNFLNLYVFHVAYFKVSLP